MPLKDGADRHKRMIGHSEFDVCELSLSSYLMTQSRDHPDTFLNKHPPDVGMIGKGRGEGGNRVMKSADLILALRLKFDYQSTCCNLDIIPKNVKIVHVRIDVKMMGEALGKPGSLKD
jgi:hypothetical protein